MGCVPPDQSLVARIARLRRAPRTTKPGEINARVTQVRQFLGRAESLKGNLENPEDRFDRELVEWTLRREVLDIQVLQIYRRNPLNYASNPDLSALLLRTVMKAVMARFAGQNVDGKLVSGKVRACLQSGS